MSESRPTQKISLQEPSFTSTILAHKDAAVQRTLAPFDIAVAIATIPSSRDIPPALLLLLPPLLSPRCPMNQWAPIARERLPKWGVFYDNEAGSFRSRLPRVSAAEMSIRVGRGRRISENAWGGSDRSVVDRERQSRVGCGKVEGLMLKQHTIIGTN